MTVIEPWSRPANCKQESATHISGDLVPAINGEDEEPQLISGHLRWLALKVGDATIQTPKTPTNMLNKKR